MATRADEAIVAETASAGQRRGGQELCEDEDWLRDVANEMEIGDGVIRVYGVGEDGVQAFTDFGIANLTELVRRYKENPAWLKRWRPNNNQPAAYAGWIPRRSLTGATTSTSIH
jgi:hypothetical protein